MIGESQYRSGTGWPKLPGVASDAHLVSDALAKSGFAVTTKVDLDAEGLKAAFEDFIEDHSYEVENRLLFYFAGHGHTLKLASGLDMGYIVPVDAPNPNSDSTGFKKKALAMQQFDTWAKGIEARHDLFLFDSCFSGSIFDLSRAMPEYISEKSLKAVRQFITSGAADEQVPDRSIFREQFLEGIGGEADRNSDGYVTGAELGEFLDEKVVSYSQNCQHPQIGKIRDPRLDKGDFVFALAAKAQEGPTIAPPRALAELLVLADRADAELYVNGKKLGPANEIYRDQSAGVEIEVEARSGYWSAKRRVTLRPGELEEISLRLELATGNLRFQLPGAEGYRLVLDGADAGALSASGVAKGLSAGAHEAELLGPGSYWEGRIEVDPSQTATVKVAPWDIGSLSIEAPRDAELRITPLSVAPDAGAVPAMTTRGSARFDRLPVGSYRIEGGGAGYESVSQTISLTKGEQKLHRPWTGGTLVVTSDPPGAAISVDGKAWGQSPLTLRNLEAGQVTVSASVSGYEETSQSQAIELGKTREVSLTLKKAPSQAPAGTAVAVGGFVRVPSGSFTMGSPVREKDRGSNETQHQVKLSAFSIGQYEVTQGEWQAVMGSNPSAFKGNDRLPVENVSWYDILVYCNKRSIKEGLKPCYSISGSTDPGRWGTVPTSSNATWNAANCDFSANGFRLPTEAEWEYSCRAGTSTATSFGDTLVSAQANFDGNNQYNVSTKGTYLSKTAIVGSYPANAWGLYDMHGNVLEWCWDWYGDYSTSLQNNPVGPSSGSYRVLRGGSWTYYGNYLRSALRLYFYPRYRFNFYGLRVVVGGER